MTEEVPFNNAINIRSEMHKAAILERVPASGLQVQLSYQEMLLDTNFIQTHIHL